MIILVGFTATSAGNIPMSVRYLVCPSSTKFESFPKREKVQGNNTKFKNTITDLKQKENKNWCNDYNFRLFFG